MCYRDAPSHPVLHHGPRISKPLATAAVLPRPRALRGGRPAKWVSLSPRATACSSLAKLLIRSGRRCVKRACTGQDQHWACQRPWRQRCIVAEPTCLIACKVGGYQPRSAHPEAVQEPPSCTTQRLQRAECWPRRLHLHHSTLPLLYRVTVANKHAPCLFPISPRSRRRSGPIEDGAWMGREQMHEWMRKWGRSLDF